MEKYRDPSLSPKERAQDLLGRMSLEEKMGQVNCLFPYGDNWDAVEKDMEHGIGQVSTLDVRVIKSLEEAAAWQRRIQEKVMEKSEHGIPAVFHMEGLCGPFIQDSMSFPSGIARGSSWDPELEEKVGEIVGRQELSCGITQVLAPVLDLLVHYETASWQEVSRQLLLAGIGVECISEAYEKTLVWYRELMTERR